MQTFIRKRQLAWFTLAGMGLGYLLVHPFAMLAYILGPQHTYVPMDFSFWGRQVRISFSSEMLAMGLAFAFMGGLSGFCLGAWHLQKERLAAEEMESQRRLAALNTLKELMVTLAHYIRNANVVIGGFSARLSKRLDDAELQGHLQLIQRASREIEAVIASFQNLTEITTATYTTQGQARMIDLKKELEAHLAAHDLPDDRPDS
jgi:signal transduction histidine kinase